MSSRLFEELREKKPLCYDISTEVRKYKDSGAFSIHLGLDKSKIIVALSSLLKELDKVKGKEVFSRELSRAKDYFLGQIAMSLELPQGRMFYLAESFLRSNKIYNFDQIKQRVEAITPEDIKNFAREIFTFENMSISCVGDISDNLKESIKKTVKKGVGNS